MCEGISPQTNSAEDRKVVEAIDPTVDVGIPEVYCHPLFLQGRHRRIHQLGLWRFIDCHN